MFIKTGWSSRELNPVAGAYRGNPQSIARLPLNLFVSLTFAFEIRFGTQKLPIILVGSTVLCSTAQFLAAFAHLNEGLSH